MIVVAVVDVVVGLLKTRAKYPQLAAKIVIKTGRRRHNFQIEPLGVLRAVFGSNPPTISYRFSSEPAASVTLENGAT